MFQLPWEILVSVAEALPFQTLGVLEITAASWQSIDGWPLVCKLWRARATDHLGGDNFLQLAMQGLINNSALRLLHASRQRRLWSLELAALWKRCLHFGHQVIASEVKRFWTDHEVQGGDICTHFSPHLGYRSLSRQWPGEWVFPDDDRTQSFLFLSIAWMHSRDVKAYIMERPTPVRPLIETLDVSTDNDFMPFVQPPWTLAGQSSGPGEFLKRRAVLLRLSHSQCRGRQHLDVLVYGARGYLDHFEHGARGYQLPPASKKWKTSIRMVWPSILVDSNDSREIRRTAIQTFRNDSENDPEGFLGSLRSDYLSDWSMAFEPVPSEKLGFRMAYTPYQNSFRTEAPFQAIGRARFHFQVSVGINQDGFRIENVECSSMVWVEASQDRSVVDWIGSASCRTKLHNTVVPVTHAAQPAMISVPGNPPFRDTA